ncbi:MAG TPA: EF-P lysine aminoacylase EpmA [Steroidobacteraceae bacterium]|nr:EF-P lysine aminoacylase EpmA [Steroidobacteraceae bacterium]
MNGADWRPVATAQVLRRRATLLEATRAFFRERGVLEVETPVVLAATATDVHVESLALAGAPPRYLQTSPEYSMKRLLAAGSGDIYQICHVFRAGESSPQHNPEFTMVEWYRLGQQLPAIMAETAALAGLLLAAGGRAAVPVESLGYAQAFERELGSDPLTTSQDDLAGLARKHGLAAGSLAAATRDELLDFLVATRVGPALGRGRLTCLHRFPASQAALAQIDPADPRTALRFELYAEGIELANGYVELADASEQRRRFAADLAERRRRGRTEPAADTRLLAALEHGLPTCAGVALGFDRVAMLALGAAGIDEVLAFPWERA